MAAKAVEALDADETPEPATPLLQQPEQTQRMADSNGVRRPLARGLGPAGNEAEIDQRGLGPIEMADEIGKDAGVETPAVNEDETHLATLHGARGAPRILFGKGTKKSVDVGVLMRRGEGQSEPRRADRDRRWPDGRSPQAGTLEA